MESLVKEREQVTYDDLLSLVPEAEERIELLETMMEVLQNAGVSVVADADERPAASAGDERGTPLGDLENIPADDLLSVYLAQMSREPLLSHAEEIALANQIESGRQAERAIQETDYTLREHERLQDRVEAGQVAREQLGRANTRLVVSIAKRYRGYGVPFPDLIQNGNVGLMRAVDRYDPDTGNRFSTYATWWIRQAVTRALANHGRIIRIPVHTGGQMRKMARIAQSLEKELGQRPTVEEIAAEMKESPHKIRQMMRWAIRPLSLEKPVGDERDAELGHFLPDEEVPRPEEITDAHLLSATLKDLLGMLTTREAQVLRLRYGLRDGQTRTLKQVADKFGLSRERIRQIEREALAKIRLVAPDYHLEHFLIQE